MDSILINTEARAVVVDPARRALLSSSCAAECCGSGPCPNYVKVRWCCDIEREAWVWMNRPDCPGYQEDIPSLSTTDPQTFRLTSDPTNTCWTTDPQGEGNIRAYADIPPGAMLLPRGANAEILDGCLDARCGECPECCGSRLMPPGCGGGLSTSERVCCECGDDYTLTITETSQSSGLATHYADPCTTFPSIGAGPSWEVSVTRTATFHFGCREVPDGSGGTRLERVVTGQSVMRRIDKEHWALIRYHFPVDQNDTCYLESFTPAYRTVTTEREFVRTWEELGGGEGCGLTREAVAQTTPHDLGLDRATFGSGAFQAASRFDLFGECNGELSQTLSACSDLPGGPNSTACRFGLGTVGWAVQWSGNKTCSGGTYGETGTSTVVTNVRVDTIVNNQPAGETLWLGAEAVEWRYDIAWQVTGGRPCFADPCGQQQPADLRLRSDTRPRDIRPRAGEPLTKEQILSLALRGFGKGCNCGKR